MKIKEIIFVVILLMLISNVYAETEKKENYNDYETLNLEFNINGRFNLEEKSTNTKIAEIIAYLEFLPIEYELQKVNTINTFSFPLGEINRDKKEIVYKWSQVNDKSFNFGLNSKIETKNAIVIVDEKIDFPIATDNNPYTKPTKYIDVNEEIIAKAEELTKGEGDLYEVVFKIGNWVHKNINYNLSSLTADVVQKSSWVMKTKEGVCDEITNLFISMVRSQGIPARFISGVVYTNLGYNWVSHGWAEVYFPNKGWVPFDVTFGQLGWIDPTHIKLKEGLDSGEATIRYTWKSRDTTIINKEIELNTKLIKKGEKIDSPLEFKIRPLINNIGPGSYVPLEVEINNEKNYYLPVSFIITKAGELTEDNIKLVLLKPGERKKIFWITKINQEIKEDYIYTSIIEVEDTFKKTESTKLTYAKELKTISLEEANKMIEEYSKRENTKISSKKLNLKCNAEKTKLIYEKTEIKCKLKNRDNIPLKEIEICLKEDCQKIDLASNEEKEIIFTDYLEKGIQNLKIEAKNKEVKINDILNIEVLENPGLEISNIAYEERAEYNKEEEIKVILSTKEQVKEIKIKINNKEITKLESLEQTKQMIFSTTTDEIYKHGQKISLEIEYKDKNNKEYTLKKEYPIEITEVPWYIKVLNKLRFYK